MIIFAHSKCKRYENRKIQGVALPKKERNGQEWKSSHHGTHHSEQDYGAVLLQVVLHSIALESSCQPIGGQEQGSRGNQQGDGYETGRRQVSTVTELPLEEIQKMRE
jgi:hypothetical protein